MAGPFAAPVWSSAFRPFFLLAAAYGPLVVLAWLPALTGTGAPLMPVVPSPSLWHGHELLFGFTGATICGFLLTALPSWAGTPTVRGPALAVLVGLWFAGRLAMWGVGILPAPVVAGLDIALFAGLLAVVAPHTARAAKKRFMAVIPVLAGFIVANALFHWAMASGDAALAALALRLAIYVLMMLFMMVAGFLVPVFTEGELRRRDPGARIAFVPWLEALAIAALLAHALTGLMWPASAAAAAAGALAAMVHLARFARWRTAAILDTPIIWVKHLAYLGLIAAFLIRPAGWLAGQDWETLSIHAFTIGAKGLMIVALISRVSLRHTGRALRPAPPVILAYVLMVSAAATRALGPLAWPHDLAAVYGASGLMWTAAFAICLWAYAPMLVAPSLPQDDSAPRPAPPLSPRTAQATPRKERTARITTMTPIK